MQKQIVSYILTGLLLTSVLFAQQGPKLEINIAEEKINISAEDLQTGITKYSPGDTILYTLTSQNVGDALMTNPVITDPIPAGVSYVMNSAQGENSHLVFSIDGGNIFGEWPLFYSVRNSKGILVKKEATADMVTHVRWEILENLEPGAVNTSRLKVVVNP